MSANDILYAPISATNKELVVPPAWFDVCKVIQDYRKPWRYSTLAGGALRDLDLSRQIKDVDIFINYVEDAGLYLLNALNPLGIRDITMVEHDAKSASKGTCPAPHYLFDYHGWHFEISQRYEVIRDHRHILDTFDLGICMIALDADKVYRSRAYQDDVKNQTITVVRETGGNEVAHAERLLKKYMGWTVVPLNRP